MGDSLEDSPQDPAVQAAASRLQAALTEPLPTPTRPESSLPISASATQLELLQTLVLRVDQVAKSNSEQQARAESVMAQMVETMQLAQVMIAQQDAQQTRLADLMDRLELSVTALVRMQANLTEVVAALLGSPGA